MPRRLAILVPIVLLALTAGIPVRAAWDEDKGCLACHAGIERFADGPVMAELACTFCHGGNGVESGNKAVAHKSLTANPADLRVVERTCGACHAEEMERVRRSLHATSAGIIDATRRAFGTPAHGPSYAARAVDGPADRPSAVARFLQLPRHDPVRPEGADNSPAHDYLRSQCLGCHLWNYGEPAAGSHRASGCAACHVAYSDAGTYEGGDRAIDRKQTGRPRLHRLAAVPPMSQCLRCHNRPDRIGRNFVGDGAAAGAGHHGDAAETGHGNGNGQGSGHGGGNGAGHGHGEGPRTADVHYQRGLACLDCHDRDDLHGDGRLYRRMADAVAIRCTNCHGTPATEATLTNARGDKLANLARKDGKVILTARDGKSHVVPQLKGAELGMMGEMLKRRLPKHLDRAECAACHAQWSPQCTGRVLGQDMARSAPDWLEDGDVADPSQAARQANLKRTAHPWEETVSPYIWAASPVAVNPRGKLAPQVPGCRVTYAPLNASPLLRREIQDPLRVTFQPHSISRQHQRHCVDCHCRTVTGAR